MKTAALLGLLLCPLFALASIDLTEYQKSHVLKENEYNVHWSVIGDELHLGLEVHTTGWIGFGIGEVTSGSMSGADIVTAQVSDSGEVHIQDRYATAKAFPELDECQSWDLVNGEERDGTTVVQLKRKLDTGDLQDRLIQSGTIRIIWAYGASDTLSYHAATRGALAMVLYGEERAEMPDGRDIQNLLLVNDNFALPLTNTVYHDQFFKLDLPQDAHIVAVEQVIDPKTRNNVHHFVVSGAFDSEGTDLTQIWAWAPGISPLVLPPQAGFRIGPGPEAYKWIAIQTHFDNPSLVPGLYDNSGVRIHYTHKLRQNDASVIELGDPVVTQPDTVHAGTGTQSFEYNCPSECTSQWPHPINVFSSLLHMHKRGNRMWTTHWRGEERVGNWNHVDYYDFGFQQQTPMNVVVQPGDRIQTHCIYNRAAQDISFGGSSDQEMCIEYVGYWPKLPNGPFCGYFFMEDRNFTLCGKDLMNFEDYNPTRVDPPGGEVVHFGTANEAGYECPVVNIALSPEAPATMSGSSAGPARFKILIGSMALLVLATAMLLS